MNTNWLICSLVIGKLDLSNTNCLITYLIFMVCWKVICHSWTLMSCKFFQICPRCKANPGLYCYVGIVSHGILPLMSDWLCACVSFPPSRGESQSVAVLLRKSEVMDVHKMFSCHEMTECFHNVASQVVGEMSQLSCAPFPKRPSCNALMLGEESQEWYFEVGVGF